jgi:DNA-binding transcriptional regulator YiaG
MTSLRRLIAVAIENINSERVNSQAERFDTIARACATVRNEPAELRFIRVKLLVMTQKQAAELLGVHVKTIQAWERGVARCPAGMFELYLLKTMLDYCSFNTDVLAI